MNSQHSNHTIQKAALFFAVSLAIAGLLFVNSKLSAEQLARVSSVLLTIRMLQSNLIGLLLAIDVAISTIVLLCLVQKNFQQKSYLNFIAPLPFLLLFLTTLPLGNRYKYHALFYENWMWLCAAWIPALGLLVCLCAWALQSRGAALQRLGERLERAWGWMLSAETQRADRALLAGLCVIAFSAPLVFNQVLLGGIPHIHDSISQYFQAKIFARGHLYAPAPAHPEFFERVYIMMDQGRWYSIFPPGFALLLSIGIRMGAPALVNPLLTAFAVPLIFALALRVTRSAAIARAAAALFTLSPFSMMMGAGYMNHPACLVWSTLFFLAYLSAFEANNARRMTALAAAAGFCFGMATLTRPVTALAFLIVALVWWALQWRGGWRNRALCLAAFIAGGLPCGAFQFYYNHATTGSALLSPYQEQYNDIPLGFGETGWGPEDVLPGKPNVVHHTVLQGLSNSLCNLNGLNYWLFGWPIPSLTLAAALFLPGMRRTRFDWFCLAAALSQSASYSLFFYQDYCFGPRFLYETMPFWLILSARGASETISLVSGSGAARRSAVRALSAIALAFCFVMAFSTTWVERLADLDDEYWGAREQAYQTLKNGLHEKNALVFVEYDYDYYAVFPLLDPWLKSGWIVALDFSPDRNQALIREYPGWPVYYLHLDPKAPRYTTVTILEKYPYPTP
ncbi:MAG: hypothetical protein GC154_13595 [bacterium]|nr:hypothetical protein [bacterium]